MDERTLTPKRTLEDIRNHLKNNKLQIDPDNVLRDVDKELDEVENGPKPIDPKSTLFRAMTVVEFETGTLMYTIVPDHYRTFAIDMMRGIQKEYDCNLPSEKSLAEVVVLSFVRVLELQRRINDYINSNLSRTDIAFFDALSKDLDRANRQYLSAIQTLRMLKQPSLNVSIKANTAFVGQNQLIQENQIVKPI